MEFEYEEVAKIAAEAMDNYLMFDKLLQCKLSPPNYSNRTLTIWALPLYDRKIFEDFCQTLKILVLQRHLL